MDGVIANFFKSFADKNNVDHWKSIKEKDKALNDFQWSTLFLSAKDLKKFAITPSISK
jgi:hypothetical protein